MSYIIVRIESSGRTVKLDFPYGTILRNDDGQSFHLGSARKGGGNGVVFEAERFDVNGSKLNKCAVKLLKELDDVRQDRFNNEVRILLGLDHPHIAKYFGHGRARLGEQQIEIPWMGMHLGGPNLREYIDRYGRLDIPTTVKICLQAAEAIEYFHSKQLIHRDIKPANFVWANEDDRENIKMLDFGIAKYTGEDVAARPMDNLTQATEFVGPANFSSPELLAYARNKSHPVDSRSDLFQMGLLLWFLATNQILAGVPSKKHDPSGGKVFSIVMDLIPMDPADRIPTASELANRLRSIS